ncbi:C2 family cysteine protease [Fontivita pretiosa]|uniref:C2 family cysteine protease n=1 Tax=Fontivita pretiosa TaxID=2989684 RepID=UPI003D16EFB0
MNLDRLPELLASGLSELTGGLTSIDQAFRRRLTRQYQQSRQHLQRLADSFGNLVGQWLDLGDPAGSFQSIEVQSFEQLEARAYLAVVPLTISTANLPGGGQQLRITASNYSDRISITRSSTGLVLRNNTWTTAVRGDFKNIFINAGRGHDLISISSSIASQTSIYGGAGNDTIYGGSGADKIYAGDGVDRILSGAGDDTIVSISGGYDGINGGAGSDSFWIDPTDRVADTEASELAGGAVHLVDQFIQYRTVDASNNEIYTDVSTELLGQRLLDPVVTSNVVVYRNFSRNPLFSDAGPLSTDVRQGQVGDCYFLAVLASVAKVNPNLIRQSIVDLGDGTYAVRYYFDDQPMYVRIDGDLPTGMKSGSLVYAQFGADNSTWVALMEKAYAFYRNWGGSYAGLSSGWMSEGYWALGRQSYSTFQTDPRSINLLETIKADLDAGKSVTYAAGDPGNAPLIGYHAYAVEDVTLDATGTPVQLKLRNPWGIDGAGNDGSDDGVVTITEAQAKASMLGVVSASLE